MEPAITCLDRATWLYNFNPQDIVVGSTISFLAQGCWEDAEEGGVVAHRVMAVEDRDGVYYYWPKGDNNPVPDGCWVAETDVTAYIIEIHKNVVPENAELRDAVNSAWAAHGAAWAAHEAAWAAHDAIYIRDCGATRCTLSSHAVFEEAVAAYDLAMEASIALQAAYDLWQCWIGVVRDSEYPGHIPRRC